MSSKKPTVNDWQDFNLKKDVEKLNKYVKRTCEIGTTAIFDIAVAFSAVLFDRLFDFKCDIVKNIIYIIALVIIFFSVLKLIFDKSIRGLRKKSISVQSREVRDYIDIFDNEIWCHVMMADSFLDLLVNDVAAENSQKKIFYFSQTCFWLNKGIDKLSTMIHKLPSIFDDDIDIIIQSKKVSTARLINLLDIIWSIEAKISQEKGNLGLEESEIQLLTSNQLYFDRLEKFIEKAARELKFDIGRFKSH